MQNRFSQLRSGSFFMEIVSSMQNACLLLKEGSCLKRVIATIRIIIIKTKVYYNCWFYTFFCINIYVSIANSLNLPVIIHANNSNKLVIEIFERYIKPKEGCVFHCFQPDMDDLNYLIRNNYYISFA